jgi:hypothetical protein
LAQFSILSKKTNLSKGQFKNDERHGNGSFYWNDKDYYVGGFEHHAISGKGTYYYADGRVYVGSFRNERKNGFGTLTYPESYHVALMEGNWKDNNLDGIGTVVW